MTDIDIDVSKYGIEDDQTVVINMPVPQGLHFHEVQDHLGAVATAFKEEFDRTDKKVNLFVFPIRPDGVKPHLEVVKKPQPGDTIVISIPVGGLKQTEIPKYLKTIRDTFLLGWDDKYPGVFLEVFGILEDGSRIEVKVIWPLRVKRDPV